MSKIALTGNANGTGTLTIAAPNTSTDRTLTLPDEAGTVLTSASNLAGDKLTGTVLPKGVPAFSAYSNSNQSISSSTWTKIQLANEDFDTASCYDHVTNYRFTPNIAGYYQINGKISTEGSSGTITRVLCALWVNGAENKLGGDVWEGNVTNTGCQANALLYMNGTTDYVELYAYVSAGTTRIIRGAPAATWFNGILIGAA